jgi:hypothetical protein
MSQLVKLYLASSTIEFKPGRWRGLLLSDYARFHGRAAWECGDVHANQADALTHADQMLAFLVKNSPSALVGTFADEPFNPQVFDDE